VSRNLPRRHISCRAARARHIITHNKRRKSRVCVDRGAENAAAAGRFPPPPATSTRYHAAPRVTTGRVPLHPGHAMMCHARMISFPAPVARERGRGWLHTGAPKCGPAISASARCGRCIMTGKRSRRAEGYRGRVSGGPECRFHGKRRTGGGGGGCKSRR